MSGEPLGTAGPAGGAETACRPEVDFSPWRFREEADGGQRSEQAARLKALSARGYELGEDCFVSARASVDPGSLAMGNRSYIAAGAYVTGEIRLGRDCSVNPYAVVRGRVRSGDAVEIADLLLGQAPPQIDAEELVERLRSWQDPVTGLVGELMLDGVVGAPAALAESGAAGLDLLHTPAGYHVLSIGYALDLLGSSFDHPITAVAEAGPEQIVAGLERQAWGTRAWSAGHWTDVLGTALHWNSGFVAEAPSGQLETLLGWLILHTDPDTGLWGSPTADEGLLQPVNGYYRASRGTFAQFGVPVPHPESVVDAVLRHARDPRHFRSEQRNACNVLDIVHPLWLTRAADHRSEEVFELSRTLLAETLDQWIDGEGFGFRAPHTSTRGLAETRPGLQGTEMWLAVVWLLADVVGISGVLGYRPRGVHRPEPAG